jgi:hypothetical protein
MISTVDEGEWSASSSSGFTPKEEACAHIELESRI